MKTHWKKWNNPDYIGAYSLGENTEMNVTIEKVVRELVTGSGGKKEECTVAYLKGQKPMILNATNCKAIAKIYNSSFIEDWANKTITIYQTKIKAFGEDGIECLRIRPVKPTLPILEESDTKNWNKIKAALKNNFTIEQIRTKWSISEQNAKKLQS
jgi:hypothetical protein